MARSYVPERGDVVWLQFNPRTGHEQAGRRPAFVVSPRAYNKKVGLALFCPITSRSKGYPFEVPLPTDGKTQGVILTDQVKSLDWKSRKAKRLERVDEDVVAEVTARLLALVEPD